MVEIRQFIHPVNFPWKMWYGLFLNFVPSNPKYWATLEILPKVSKFI